MTTLGNHDDKNPGAAVSAPTALAVRMADAAGMTLVAIARKDGFEVFTHPHRVEGALRSHVA